MILSSANISYSKNQEKIEKWLKIKPIISTRKDVEKIFGKADDESIDSASYYKKNITIEVMYSRGNCKQYKHDYDVPTDTVIEIHYFFKKDNPNLNDLKLNSKDFQLEQEGDVGHISQYHSYKRGIIVVFHNTKYKVTSIKLAPSEEQEKTLDCSISN